MQKIWQVNIVVPLLYRIAHRPKSKKSTPDAVMEETGEPAASHQLVLGELGD